VLADVIEGGGYTPDGQTQAELLEGDAQAADPPAPDAEVLRAQNALHDLSNLSQVRDLIAEKIIDEVEIDYTTSPPGIWVSVKTGKDIRGFSYADIVKSQLPTSFGGFEVDVREVGTDLGKSMIWGNVVDGAGQTKAK
jgi:hypothetical protein